MTDKRTISFQGIYRVVRDVARSWTEDDLSSYSAAIAFFTIFSMAPILLIATAVAGQFWGHAQVWGEIIAVVRQLAGMEAASVLEFMLFEWSSGAGVAASFMGIVLMIWGASKVFVQIQVALNAIWGKQTMSTGKSFVRKRMFSFVMVLLVGVWMVMSLFLDAGLRTAIQFVPETLLPFIYMLDWVSEVADIVIAALLFALMYKFLPEAKVYWRGAFFGGTVCAILFAIGRMLIGLYLVKIGASTFGAAGSLIVLLVWVYYSVQIFLFAAQCSYLFSKRFDQNLAETK